MIEADGPHRPAFARWCLAQDPPIQTASATGFLVPLDLYPSVPPELLEGAYIDGYPYGGAQSMAGTPADAGGPVTGAGDPEPLGSASEVNYGPDGEGLIDLGAMAAERPKAVARKRAARRKATT